MSNELRQLLFMLAIIIPIGVLFGLAIRLLYPEGAKKFAVYSVNRTWRFWLFGCTMFFVLAISAIASGRFWIGGSMSFLFVLQLYFLVQSLRTSTASKKQISKQ